MVSVRDENNVQEVNNEPDGKCMVKIEQPVHFPARIPDHMRAMVLELT